MATSTEPLTVGVVAELLGVTAGMVRKLDGALAPARDAYGRRVYSPERVSELIAARAARRQRP